jgi:hypothetical protein
MLLVLGSAVLGMNIVGSDNGGPSIYISAAALLVSVMSLLVAVLAYRGSRPRITIDHRVRSYKRPEDAARQTAIHFLIRNHGGHDTELSGWHLDVLEPGVTYRSSKTPERTGAVGDMWTVRGHGFVRLTLYIEIGGTDALFVPLELSVHLASGRESRSSGLLVPTDTYPDAWFGT